MSIHFLIFISRKLLSSCWKRMLEDLFFITSVNYSNILPICQLNIYALQGSIPKLLDLSTAKSIPSLAALSDAPN